MHQVPRECLCGMGVPLLQVRFCCCYVIGGALDAGATWGGCGEGMELDLFKRHKYAIILGCLALLMPSQALLSYTTQNSTGWPFGSQPSTGILCRNMACL